MRIIKKHLHGVNLAIALITNAPKAVLSFEQRRRSRHKITLDTGEAVGLILNQGTILRHGDILVADDGKFILVHAAAEPVLRVVAQQSPQQLTRAAYHLGNRHILLEVGPDYLQLEYDPVLVDMLRQLGGVNVTQVEQPFEPDAGAYGGGHKHGHDDTFAEDYALAQAAYDAHSDPATPVHDHGRQLHGHGHDNHAHHSHGHDHHSHDHDHDNCAHPGHHHHKHTNK
ncbi:urease accessory protein UreE [Alcaligenaceae bacterium]|nr:urease accessory protein UreE [Alcaligenaceae bacterium]